MNEEWKVIPSFPDYEASSLGRIRRVTPYQSTWAGRVRKQYVRDDGYHVVKIGDRPRYVHRLVCEAFHGPAPDGMQAAHGDGVRSNNEPGNLSWSTRIDNEKDKVRHGTKLIGARVPNAKLTDEQVISIRGLYRLKMATQTQIAARFGVNQTKISDIVNRKTWRHVE